MSDVKSPSLSAAPATDPQQDRSDKALRFGRVLQSGNRQEPVQTAVSPSAASQVDRFPADQGQPSQQSGRADHRAPPAQGQGSINSQQQSFEDSAQSASDLFNAMVDSQREQAVRSVETVLDQVWRTYGLK